MVEAGLVHDAIVGGPLRAPRGQATARAALLVEQLHGMASVGQEASASHPGEAGADDRDPRWG